MENYAKKAEIYRYTLGNSCSNKTWSSKGKVPQLRIFGRWRAEVGIYKRKQESKKTKKELDKESDQEKRKQELDQKSDQEEKKVFSFFLGRF